MSGNRLQRALEPNFPQRERTRPLVMDAWFSPDIARAIRRRGPGKSGCREARRHHVGAGSHQQGAGRCDSDHVLRRMNRERQMTAHHVHRPRDHRCH
jgi:hypothetical protein